MELACDGDSDKGTTLLDNNQILVNDWMKCNNNGKRITVLNLNNIGLTELPEELAVFINLNEINLSGNKLKDLPRTLVTAKRLQILNLSNNQFKSVPECLLTGLRALNHINLSKNKLEQFNEPPACLSLLRELLLANNLIYEVPNWILYDYVYVLNILDLSCNPCFRNVREFPIPCKNRIRGCIRTLKLQNTNFGVTLIGLFSYFPSLVSLDISNRLAGLNKSDQNIVTDSCVSNLPANLLELNLSNNCLVRFPDMSSLEHLKSLDVSFNTLHWLPTNLSLPSKINHVNLSCTNLLILPEYLSQLSNLTQLILAENELNSLPTSFHLLNNLEVLDLYNNSLQTMPDLQSLKKLKALDVWMNFFEPPKRPLDETMPNYEDMKLILRKMFDCPNRWDKTKEVVEEIDPADDRGSSLCSSSPDISLQLPETEQNNSTAVKAEEELWELNDTTYDPGFDYLYGHQVNKTFDDQGFLRDYLTTCPQVIQTSPHLYVPLAERCPGSENWKLKQVRAQIPLQSTVIDGQFDDA